MMKAKDVYQTITTNLEGFKARASQEQMINEIDECFSLANPEIKDGNNIVLIEAPTGTGKSLAYLTAGIINARNKGKKLVISTATKVLQSQLIEKDLPLFIKSSKVKCSFALAKGRGNYLCPVSLELSLVQTSDDMFNAPDNKVKENLNTLDQAFKTKVWDGDIDKSPIAINSNIKQLITTDKDRCLNYSCAYNQKDNLSCPFYLNRDSLREVDVIVTNHSLLLADINLPSGAVLPLKPSEYLLCLDEGHNFVDSAISSATARFNITDMIHSLDSLAKFLYSAGTNSYIPVENAKIEQLLEHNEGLLEQLHSFSQLLNQNIELFQDNRLILNEYISPNLGAVFNDVFINFGYIANEMVIILDNILTKLKELLKTKGDEVLNTSINRLGYYSSKVQLLLDTSNYILNKDDSRYNANAKWVEVVTSANEVSFIINAGLTHAGNLLYNKLWLKVYACVITSATLYITDEFNYYKAKLGLNLLNKVKSLRLNTSFTYAKQSQIVIPKFSYAPEFNNKELFNQELASYLTKVLSYTQAYGTLVLFFNKTQLHDVYNNLSDEIKASILLQSSYLNNQKLIEEHKSNIDKGNKSIIFGLNSFAEGVDLPSLYCMHVIISKIPFETHNTPHNLVQDYWVKFEKGNSFVEISLPEACIKLVQSSGRLIRSEDDYGQLSICDNRIITKTYGQTLLKALPKFNRNYNKDFLNESFSKLINRI